MLTTTDDGEQEVSIRLSFSASVLVEDSIADIVLWMNPTNYVELKGLKLRRDCVIQTHLVD